MKQLDSGHQVSQVWEWDSRLPDPKHTQVLSGGRSEKGPTNVLKIGAWGPEGHDELHWDGTNMRQGTQAQEMFRPA